MMREIVLALAALGWLTLSVMQLAGGRFVHADGDYSPSYKWLKQIFGTVGLLAFLAAITGLNLVLWYRLAFIGILLVGTVVESLHIARRNRNRRTIRLRTIKGVAYVRDKDENTLIVSEAAAIIRHSRMRSDASVEVDDAAVIEVREALGIASASEWETNIRAQAAARRARLSEDGIVAAEVDLWKRELGGGRRDGEY